MSDNTETPATEETTPHPNEGKTFKMFNATGAVINTVFGPLLADAKYYIVAAWDDVKKITDMHGEAAVKLVDINDETTEEPVETPTDNTPPTATEVSPTGPGSSPTILNSGNIISDESAANTGTTTTPPVPTNTGTTTVNNEGTTITS